MLYQGTLCILCVINLASGQCTAKLKFPTVNRTSTIRNPTANTIISPLNIDKGSSLKVPFSLDARDCFPHNNNEDYIALTISRKKCSKPGCPFLDFCKLLSYANGTCGQVHGKKCGCVEDDEAEIFLRKEDQDNTDETMWKLTADLHNESNVYATVRLVVEYPPKVSALQVLAFNLTTQSWDDMRSAPVSPGVELDIRCVYDAGDPPVSADKMSLAYGTVEVQAARRYEGDKKDGQRVASLRMKGGVRCDDSHAAICRVSGASKNISSTLLVKCPPIIQDRQVRWFKGTFHQPVDLLFPLHSHTADLTSCTIVSKDPGALHWPHVREEGETRNGKVFENCSKPGREFSISGTPPNVTLKLVYNILLATDNGEKLLIISNDAGSDNVTFGLNISGIPGADADTDHDGDSSSNLNIAVYTSVIGIFIIISVVVTVVLVRRSVPSCRIK